MNCLNCVAFNFSGSLGLATETNWPGRAVWFALPGLEFDWGDQFAGGYRAGLGLTVGLLLQPAIDWKVLASVTDLDFRLGETGSTTRAVLQQNVALSQDLSLEMNWRYLEGVRQLEIGLRVYF